MFKNLPQEWQKFLNTELKETYLNELEQAVLEAYKNKVVFPALENIFMAFALCAPVQTKVIILGQDPYHQPGQAQGLSFSVPDNFPLPPSLVNIYKELDSDLTTNKPKSGNLESWAKQGVLLLNSTLTVEDSKPGSHQKFGWEKFTDTVIQKLSDEKKNLVFILWGNFAAAKENLIDSNKHLILKAPHPSPLSSYRGFFGSKPFSQTNKYLKEHTQKEIAWH